MSLTSRKTGVPLFHCVDLEWKGEGYIFQYFPKLKAEVECAINTLYPMAQYYFPDAELEDSFTSEIAEKCAGYKFNPVTDNVEDQEKIINH
jgi:hypothetical protein